MTTCKYPEQDQAGIAIYVYNVDIAYNQSEDEYTGARNIAALSQELFITRGGILSIKDNGW